MPVLDDEGLPLHYVVCGHGEPVLLIHGLGLRATMTKFFDSRDGAIAAARALITCSPVSPKHQEKP